VKFEGVASTLAGSVLGMTDGPGEVARFNGPVGLSMDSMDNAYVADTVNFRIRKVTSSGRLMCGSGCLFC
jgi:hypothetical protein